MKYQHSSKTRSTAPSWIGNLPRNSVLKFTRQWRLFVASIVCAMLLRRSIRLNQPESHQQSGSSHGIALRCSSTRFHCKRNPIVTSMKSRSSSPSPKVLAPTNLVTKPTRSNPPWLCEQVQDVVDHVFLAASLSRVRSCVIG